MEKAAKKKPGITLLDGLRTKKKTITLTNQAIIELAYSVKEMIETAKGHKLYVEQARGVTASFYHIRQMLKAVDTEYLDTHHRVRDFYREGRELSNDNDRLRFQKREWGFVDESDIPL